MVIRQDFDGKEVLGDGDLEVVDGDRAGEDLGSRRVPLDLGHILDRHESRGLTGRACSDKDIADLCLLDLVETTVLKGTRPA